MQTKSGTSTAVVPENSLSCAIHFATHEMGLWPTHLFARSTSLVFLWGFGLCPEQSQFLPSPWRVIRVRRSRFPQIGSRFVFFFDNRSWNNDQHAIPSFKLSVLDMGLHAPHASLAATIKSPLFRNPLAPVHDLWLPQNMTFCCPFIHSTRFRQNRNLLPDLVLAVLSTVAFQTARGDAS